MVETFNPDEWEVVWNGGMRLPLLPSRTQKPDPTWEPPKRIYNKKEDKVEKELGHIAFDEDNDGVTASDELHRG